jgi:hypothetical protein
MKWAVHVTSTVDLENAYTTFVENPEEKRPLR